MKRRWCVFVQNRLHPELEEPVSWHWTRRSAYRARRDASRLAVGLFDLMWLVGRAS